ncbi:sodium/hydrogen exchanger 9B2-like isoform X1 [Periplaneta americana]|uniref:sodium/hydrogen exchanger 9B2-like isoform X1 n=2 Tax=Periplaneta americana TaxID=6978 RepID=UPI0037E967D1
MITVSTTTSEMSTAEPEGGSQQRTCGTRFQRCVMRVLSHPWCIRVSRPLALWVLGLMLWGLAAAKLGPMAGPDGQLFRIGLLGVVAHLVGFAVGLTGLPPLLGMMVAGVILRNVDVVVVTGPYLDVASAIREMALVVILIRAGLELDPIALKRLGGMVLRIAICPAVVEAVCVAAITNILLDLPWIWGSLLGAVLAAVSPEVVIPLLFTLQTKGNYGKSKGIPTIVIAAASFDDVVAISAFGVLLSIATSTGDITSKIIQCPVGLVIGICCGLGLGLFLRYIPRQDDNLVTTLRTLLLAAAGLFLVFGSAAVGYEGAGPLACIMASFFASNGWAPKEKHTVEKNFALLYTIFQPLQFGLIGIEINVNVLEGRTVGLGIASLLASLAARIAASIAVAAGGNLNLKEKLFISFAWFPKATVQAALGPVALDIVRKMQLQEFEKYANIVLIVAVLSILITAPVGAILISYLGPRLLEKEKDESCTAPGDQQLNNLSGEGILPI